MRILAQDVDAESFLWHTQARLKEFLRFILQGVG